MDQRLVFYLVQHMLTTQFRSKQMMATALEVPYRSLLDACSENAHHQNILLVAKQLLRYCIKYQIDLDTIVTGFQ